MGCQPPEAQGRGGFWLLSMYFSSGLRGELCVSISSSSDFSNHISDICLSSEDVLQSSSVFFKPQERAVGMNSCICWGWGKAGQYVSGAQRHGRGEKLHQAVCCRLTAFGHHQLGEAICLARTPGSQKTDSHCTEAES